MHDSDIHTVLMRALWMIFRYQLGWVRYSLGELSKANISFKQAEKSARKRGDLQVCTLAQRALFSLWFTCTAVPRSHLQLVHSLFEENQSCAHQICRSISVMHGFAMADS